MYMNDFPHQSEYVMMENNIASVNDMYAMNSNGKKTRVKWKIIIAVLVIAVLFEILYKLGEDSNESKTIKYDCDTGALLNMDLETFCLELNENVNKSYEEAVGENPKFDITKYLNNLVEPQVFYEDISGCKGTMYSAFIDKRYMVTISEIDGKVSQINVGFDDDMSLPIALAHSVIRTLSGLDFDECEKIREIIGNGIMERTCVYKDGILYGILIDPLAYYFVPASEEFVKKIEDSGSKIVYWDSLDYEDLNTGRWNDKKINNILQEKSSVKDGILNTGRWSDKTINNILQEKTSVKDEITNNESSTSLDITKRTEKTTDNFEEETTVPKVDNIIKLGEFADYDNIIKIGSSNKYKVQFDGEIFDMQVSSYRQDISDCEDSVFWSEKNVAIIIDDDYSMNNKFYCSINAFNDYFSCERVMEAGYKVTGISISCLSNDNYKFDIENTRELHDFLINIADKMIKMYPVDEGINITSFTEYDKLIKLNSNNDIRVSFDNEVFDIHVSTYMSDLFFPISEGECLLWYDGDVAVELDYMYTRYDGDFHIYIRKLGEEFVPGEYPSVDSHIVASVDLWCVTDKYYEYDVANTEELYQFIINLAKKMMNHEY